VALVSKVVCGLRTAGTIQLHSLFNSPVVLRLPENQSYSTESQVNTNTELHVAASTRHSALQLCQHSANRHFFNATYLQARLLAGFSLMQGVPFLALVNIAAHLGDQIAQKPQLWGVNSIFRQTRQILKRSYFWNYCINHNQILHSDVHVHGWTKYGSNKSKMADGRHLENQNILISQQQIEQFWKQIWHGNGPCRM